MARRPGVLAAIAVALAVLALFYWRFVMMEGSVVQVGLVPVRVHEEFASDERMQRLVLAASQGRKRRVETLVAEGADVNRPGDFYRLTPLMWVTMHGSLDGARLLLELGADPNARVSAVTEDDIEITRARLMRSGERLSREAAASRLETFGGESAISFAVRTRRLDLLELLLEAGGDPNIQGRTQPVLFTATQPGPDEVNPALVMLLDFGADPNLTRQSDGGGASAVDWFTFRGNIETAIYLIGRGADPARSERWQMPGVRLAREDLTEENSVPWNHAAAIVQRFLPENPDPESRLYRLKTLMEDGGVTFPVFDPNRPISIEESRAMSLLEFLQFRSMPDADIERVIDYHTRNGSLHLLETLPEDFARHLAEKQDAGHPR